MSRPSSPPVDVPKNLDWGEMTRDWIDALVEWDRLGAPFEPRFSLRAGRLRVLDTVCRHWRPDGCRCLRWISETFSWTPAPLRRADHVVWALTSYRVTTELFDLARPPLLLSNSSVRESRQNARHQRERCGLSYLRSQDRRGYDRIRDRLERLPLNSQIDFLESIDHAFGAPEPESPQFAVYQGAFE